MQPTINLPAGQRPGHAPVARSSWQRRLRRRATRSKGGVGVQGAAPMSRIGCAEDPLRAAGRGFVLGGGAAARSKGASKGHPETVEFDRVVERSG